MSVIDYMEKHKLWSAILLIWTYGLLTWVVYRVFDDISLINAAVVSALSAVVGIPAAAVALFKWRRGDKSGAG